MFKVFNPEKKVQDTVYFKLVECGTEREVVLIACDEYGESIPAGHILTITIDGELFLHGGVKVNGIKTDEHGRIKILS